jgi:hypothetical protein
MDAFQKKFQIVDTFSEKRKFQVLQEIYSELIKIHETCLKKEY